MGKADAILFLMSDRRRGKRRERNRQKFCIMSDEARRKDGTVFCIMSSEESREAGIVFCAFSNE